MPVLKARGACAARGTLSEPTSARGPLTPGTTGERTELLASGAVETTSKRRNGELRFVAMPGTGPRDSLPNNVRAIRDQRGLTRLQLAARADLAMVTVQSAEAGRCVPTPETLAKLAAALGVEVEALGYPLLTSADHGRRGAEHTNALRRARSAAAAAGPPDLTGGDVGPDVPPRRLRVVDGQPSYGDRLITVTLTNDELGRIYGAIHGRDVPIPQSLRRRLASALVADHWAACGTSSASSRPRDTPTSA